MLKLLHLLVLNHLKHQRKVYSNLSICALLGLKLKKHPVIKCKENRRYSLFDLRFLQAKKVYLKSVFIHLVHSLIFKNALFVNF